MADALTITFDGGQVAAVYDDQLLPALQALGGALEVTRASHVEPAPGGGWLADMSPVGGPLLGASGEIALAGLVPAARPHAGRALAPFPTRAEALAAERAWLARERGL